MSWLNRRTLLAAALLGASALCPVVSQAQIGRLRRVVAGPSPEIRRLLERVDTTRALFDRATSLLLRSSWVMEAVVSTQERRAEIRRQLASVDSLEQRGGENRVQLDAQDRATRLEQATAERRFEQQQLSEGQARNVTNVGFNTALALLMDAFAFDEASHLVQETQTAAQSIANEPAQAIYFNRLREAATQDLPAIVNAIPQQRRLGAAIHASVQQARAANQAVQVTEASALSAPPRPIDINAI